MNHNTDINWIILCIIIIILIIPGIFIPYLRHRDWIKYSRIDYKAKAIKDIYDQNHYQRVKLWLNSKDAEKSYIRSPINFNLIYINKVDEIGEELIKELQEKYYNEYKSGNTKNT